MKKRYVIIALVFITNLLMAFASIVGKPCFTVTKKTLSLQEKSLYDSLLNTTSYRYHETIQYVSESIRITDSVRIKPLSIDSIEKREFYPQYLQFEGKLVDFMKYVTVIDKSIDSIVYCENRIVLYASDCDLCDTGFFSGTKFLPTQFNYYRFHEIYGSFFNYPCVHEVQVFVNKKNKTYIPYASDLSVLAPLGVMKRSYYISNVDYSKFFPDEFPSQTNNEFSIDQYTGEYMWTAKAAIKKTKAARK